MGAHMSDEELIDELQKRFDEAKRALFDLRIVSDKLEKVNQKLQRSEQMKGNFLSNIRNEIINPLSSIMGLSSEIIDGTIEQASIPNVARMIHAEAFDLDFQLRNIFVAAEIEAGEMVFSPSSADVAALLNDVVDSFSNKVADGKKKVSLRLEPSGGLLFKTDAEKLQCIASNLLANAIEYSHKGGLIEISARMDGSKLVLSVGDTGIGIEKEKRDEIFDRFRQIEEGIRKSHRGHGLGLSIVKALVDAMDGSICLECHPGAGSVFTVILPEAKGEIPDIFSEGGNEFIFGGEEEVL